MVPRELKYLGISCGVRVCIAVAVSSHLENKITNIFFQNRKHFLLNVYLERRQPGVCLLRIAGTGTAQGGTQAGCLSSNAGDRVLSVDHQERVVTRLYCLTLSE